MAKRGPKPRTSKIQRIGDGIAIVELTRGLRAAIDECDYDLVAGLRWRSHHVENCWYAIATVRNPEGARVSLSMHRMLLGLGRGDVRLVDHEDGNGLNNRRHNIRIATVSQNAQNKRKHKPKSSQYKGVVCDRRSSLNKRWKATIFVNGKHVRLGYLS